ncbi:MAG: phenylalanine--tRNA ligase subunit alpha [Alphaproteobacteria bacterium]|nr:phenylalanine--tRNA ligase subunit alpha [Alphaproteobacteria bacterium]NCQ66646.1 phenylalanine--tRNA ligase subunit alpha [Alphaproteobacteria bacterium]NCT06998.1 phenylalanine--tRNA ligase subunit alpha [Alphaproteobacteria bacterium]
MTHIEDLQTAYLNAVKNAKTLPELEEIRLNALGKQGEISILMKTLGKMEPRERQEKGVLFNSVRTQIATALEERKAKLAATEMAEKLKAESLDVSLSARGELKGAIHPLSQAQYELTEIFSSMGFHVVEGPHIEDDFHNFSALNIPPEHPAREEQDTFYLPKGEDGEILLLRTQTSPVQIRTMQNKQPPVRIVAPGRVYRSDYDQTHTPTFHQIEGLFIDRNIHMGHLKRCVVDFCRAFFEIPDLELRFRPSFFPFTEPSAEVDIACVRRDGELILGETGDWLEVLGCGMVHPKVLDNCGINSTEYQGFAFGLGIERMAMLKYGIPDLRSFYDTDNRWLRHYGFSAFEALMGGAK